MDCPFQVGDEVVRVKPDSPDAVTRTGVVYVIEGILANEQTVRLFLAGVDNGDPDWVSGWWGHLPENFRKVERKTDRQSLTEWLSQPAGDTDHIDRSAPIAPRKRERAS